MKRNLLIFSLFTVLAVAPTRGMAAEMEMPAAELAAADEARAVISVSEQTITVSGAQGETLEVVSLTGKVVKTIAIDSPAQRIELNLPKGCYILKVGKVVRKISIR